MSFPLTFWDISLWLVITAIILLITSVLISPYYGKTNILINKKRLNPFQQNRTRSRKQRNANT